LAPPRDPHRRVAIPESVSSDVNGLRRHFRVVESFQSLILSLPPTAKAQRVELTGRRGPAAKPGPPRSWQRRSGLFRQPLPMVAVAAQIVHFVAKLISIGFHLGKELAQPHQLRFQDRALGG
jgi:hypothetical protein